MIKLNQWDDPEPNLDPPEYEEPEIYCYRCGKTLESGDKYFSVRRLFSSCVSCVRVLCMDCVDYYTEEA